MERHHGFDRENELRRKKLDRIDGHPCRRLAKLDRIDGHPYRRLAKLDWRHRLQLGFRRRWWLFRDPEERALPQRATTAWIGRPRQHWLGWRQRHGGLQWLGREQ